MNWLDGIIGFFSPEWGARREAGGDAWMNSGTTMPEITAGETPTGVF